MDFGNCWCKMKLRVCLFSFCCFQHTFVGSRTTKTFSETKSCVFLLSLNLKLRSEWDSKWWKSSTNITFVGWKPKSRFRTTFPPLLVEICNLRFWETQILFILAVGQHFPLTFWTDFSNGKVASSAGIWWTTSCCQCPTHEAQNTGCCLSQRGC